VGADRVSRERASASLAAWAQLFSSSVFQPFCSAVPGAAEVGAQAEDGLRVNLANARLRQAENRCDFRQAHVFKVIHGKYLPGNIGQFGHPLSNSLPGAILRKLAETITEVGNRSDVKLIVLRSEGTKAFWAGASFLAVHDLRMRRHEASD